MAEVQAVEDIVIEPVVEQEVQTEVEGEVKEEVQEVAQEAESEKPKEEPLPKGVQKRIDRAVRQKYEAEARAKVLEERLAQIEKQMPQQKPADNEPKLEQFENIEDYVTAKARWITKQELNTTFSERDRKEAESKAQAAKTQTVDHWTKQIQAFKAEMPDYDDVVGSSDVNFEDANVLQAIQTSEIGPKIAYYLASNPDEADDIASLRGIDGIRAIGRLEARLLEKRVSVTKTPPPIKPVGQKSSATADPDKMSTDEWLKWRNKQTKR